MKFEFCWKVTKKAEKGMCGLCGHTANCVEDPFPLSSCAEVTCKLSCSFLIVRKLQMGQEKMSSSLKPGCLFLRCAYKYNDKYLTSTSSL
jgi:hypothetical protein